MADYTVAQASVLIVPKLDGFHKKLDAQLQAQQHKVDVELRAQTAKMVAQIKAAKELVEQDKIKLQIDDVGITKSITEIRHKYEDLQREMKKALILDIKVAGMALLPQIAQGLAAANASMVQLAQSAALLPGILSGVLSSVGALATGLGGVKNAFREYGEAQKNAASEGLKARNAALNVNNAYRDLNRTVKDAKRSIEDLNAQLRDAPLDEADAIIRVQEARAEAADKAGKSGLQQQKDILNLIKSENELADTRLRNSRLVEDVAVANAKGVAGADAVVDATDRLSKAMDDASTKSTKLTDSLKQLSPNAQEFVTSVTGMQESFTGFKNAVQDKLFEGLGAEVVKLGQNDLPILQKGFSAIAGEINGNVKVALASLQTDTNKGFFERIFGNTAAAQANIDKAINPLVDALLRMSAVGSDFLPRLADGLSDVLTRFDNFIVRAESDGSLVKWMDSGINALKELGNSIINIGSMLSSLNDAFTDSGGNSLLKTLEAATQRVAELMRSADGQDKLKNFFIETREELAKWRPLLEDIPEIFKNLADTARAWSDILLPFLTRAGRLLAEHPILIQAIFSSFLLWKNVAPVVKALYGGLGSLTEALTKLNTSVFANSTGHIGRFATATQTAKDKVNGMSAAILSTGGLVAAATLAVTWIGTRLLNAHDDARAAAQRQTADLNELRDSLDDVTGSATNASRALTAKSLQQGVNEATGQNYGNLLPLLNDPKAAIDAVAAGDVKGALAQIKGGAITASDVTRADGGKFWREKGQSLTDFGLNAQDVADALNGNPEKYKKYQEWQDEGRRIAGLPSAASKVVLEAFPSRAQAMKAPSLKDLQAMLPDNGAVRAAAAGELQAKALAVTSQGADIREANAAAYGRAALKPVNPFNQYGVLVAPALGPDGAVLYTQSKPADGSPEEEQLRSAGVTFSPEGDRFKVELSKAATNTYLDAYASGGFISGPGSGTSDSILARLSHGEYVINANSTAKHKPLLDQINSGGLPGYAPGGLIPKAPAPAPPPIVPSLLDTGASAYKPGINSSGATMDAANRPGEFNRTNFQSAGQAQAARRGTDTAAKAASYDPGPNALTSGFSAFENFMGEDTYTMRVTTENSAYNALRTPTPESRRRPMDDRPDRKFIDPNAPKNLTEFGSQLLGVPLSNDPATRNLPYPTAGVPAKLPYPGTPPVTPVTPVTPTAPAATAPKAAEAGYTGIQQHVLGAKPGPINPVQALPGILSTPVVGPLMAANLAPYAGLAVGSNINYGQGGFPDWVYQAGQRFGMSASTYAGHQEGGGTNKGIDWAPTDVSWNTPEGAQRMTDYAKYLVSLGTMEQIIYQNPFTGETVGVANGRPVGPGTDQPQYYAADWATHQDHIHTRTSLAIPLPEQLAALGISLGGSPSNMPMAGTPAGVMLPQMTFGPTGSGGGSATIADMLKGTVTAEQYAKYVSDAWQETLKGLVQNAGGIALDFLGSFFGVDFSPLQSIANSVIGGIGGGGSSSGGSGGAAGSSDVSAILGGGSLPAEYQQIYDQTLASTGDPNAALAALQQVLGTAQQYGAGSPSGYDPNGGAEQWRPVVRQAVQALAPKHGITNAKAWEDALVKQIQTESGGNPSIDNLNDSNGQGGTQQVFGLGQFLPSTFASHNVLNGDIHDPVASIYAMVDYVATKYGMDASGAPLQIGRGVGYAHGGKIKGMGGGKSDSILARVSNGEYIVNAGAASKNMGLLNAINSGVKLPGFSEGGLNGIPPVQPPPIVPPPPPPPPPSPVPPDPMGPTAGAEAGQPSAPAPVAAVNAPGDAESGALAQVGDVLSSVGQSVGGAAPMGAEAPAGASPTGDPRSALAAAPQNLDHNNPAVSKGIQAAGSAISSAISTAMSTAGMAGAGVGGGAASSAASSMISGLVNVGTGAATGAVNILSSLLVGTATRNGTAGAYGTPLTPDANGQKPYAGPSVVNNWNGGVHTSNNEEFYRIQQRRELQNAAPMLPNR